jgi:hypothetical protein
MEVISPAKVSQFDKNDRDFEQHRIKEFCHGNPEL